MSRITGANTGKWVRLVNDLARTTTTPEASTGQWLILVTLEADQAVQEARFAGACHNQHAGRPAPSLGWPGERKQGRRTSSWLLPYNPKELLKIAFLHPKP